MGIYRSPEGQQALMDFYDEVLSHWPVPFESRTISTRFGDTHLIVSGDVNAPAMILLHGASSNAMMWIGDIADYSREYRVYALDIPGEPGRSAPEYLSWQDDTFVHWMTDVLDALAIPGATLVGISQGGWIALKAASQMPERVNCLVLLTPGGVVPSRASWLPRAFLMIMLGRRGSRRLTRDLFGSEPVPEGTEEAIALISEHYKPRMSNIPVLADSKLMRVTMPTLLVGGDQDICLDTHRIAQRLQQFVPHLEVLIIPGAGHALVHTTVPVLAFLNAERVPPSRKVAV